MSCNGNCIIRNCWLNISSKWEKRCECGGRNIQERIIPIPTIDGKLLKLYMYTCVDCKCDRLHYGEIYSLAE